MIEFEKPKIHKVEESNNYGKFVVEPLESGYGTTLGNSLRRTFKLMAFCTNSPL